MGAACYWCAHGWAWVKLPISFLRVVTLGRANAEEHRSDHGSGIHPQLSHHVFGVAPSGVLRNAKLLRDLLVGCPERQEPRHLELALRETEGLPEIGFVAQLWSSLPGHALTMPSSPESHMGSDCPCDRRCGAVAKVKDDP